MGGKGGKHTPKDLEHERKIEMDWATPTSVVCFRTEPYRD